MSDIRTKAITKEYEDGTQTGSIQSFTIDRSKWLRGRGDGALRNYEGKMCCLGFFCLALGATKKDILGQPMPANVCNPIVREKTPWLFQETTAVDLSDVNDDLNISEEEREDVIKAAFLKNGWEVKFVG